MHSADVAILGAGMVGVSAALHLQARGRDVALIDRHGAAGLETSFGNAGLIERASMFPYLFPRDPKKLALYALNLLPEAHYHLSALPGVAPWLWRYYRESAPDRVARNSAGLRPLIEHSLSEHEALIDAAGARDLMRKTGWIKLYRSQKTMDAGALEAEKLRSFGLNIDTLDETELARREPHLSGAVGGVHYLDPASIDDPSRLAQAYADLFVSRGGRFITGDAHGLQEAPDGRWSVATHEGHLIARDLVVALGPWSDLVFRAFGYDFPLAVKRGYHMHYAPREGASLTRPVLDADNGYVLAPMTRGIRLTTGANSRAGNLRQRPCRSNRPSRSRAGFFHSQSGSIQGPGWDAARASRTCCRSSARRRATRDCGSTLAISITASRSVRSAGGCSPK